ncbi:hypothetical protein JHL18_05880 [Clostridium sp. YIM B02505]|uniref:Tetratricopeptide repeat protein n=1 Tax=Clostridium yunnanense TaxID=2800325 RepID=A0ABS1ELE5_9CLOT|nr:hypothetical protein [Clostridium yunnanense]MBK1810164.1 hypothetical protein [Clostridium yunnanense]
MNKKIKKVLIGIIIAVPIIVLAFNINKNIANNRQVETLLASGEGLIKNNKYDEAEEKYKKALQLKNSKSIQNKIDDLNSKKLSSGSILKEADTLIEGKKVEEAISKLKEVSYKSEDMDYEVYKLQTKAERKREEIEKEKERLRIEEIMNRQRAEAEQARIAGQLMVEKQNKALNATNSSTSIGASSSNNTVSSPNSQPTRRTESLATAEGIEYNLTNNYEPNKLVHKIEVNGKTLNISANKVDIVPIKGYLPYTRFLKAGVKHLASIRSDLNLEKLKFYGYDVDGSFYLEVYDNKTIVYSCEFSLYLDKIQSYYSNK